MPELLSGSGLPEGKQELLKTSLPNAAAPTADQAPCLCFDLVGVPPFSFPR